MVEGVICTVAIKVNKVGVLGSEVSFRDADVSDEQSRSARSAKRTPRRSIRVCLVKFVEKNADLLPQISRIFTNALFVL